MQHLLGTRRVSVVWVIEKRKALDLSAAHALMGDFAVRVFASVESFRKLLRVGRKQLPGLVLIDLDDCTRGEGFVTETGLCDLLACALGDVPVVLLHAPLGEGVRPLEKLPTHVHRCLKPIDGLGFSSFVADVMKGGRQRGVIRYRDLMLDYERFCYVLAPSDEAHSLPLKEAQLLKLFLEQPGVCLSRERIRTAIWSGVKVTPRTIDSHVSRLRKRLQDAQVTIESIYGDGYILR